MDDTAGLAALEWTRYAGAQPFAEYLVLRNRAKSTVVETLAVLQRVDQTTFADTSLIAAIEYEYRVAVVNTAGFEMSSAVQFALPLELPTAELMRADFDAGNSRIIAFDVEGNYITEWGRKGIAQGPYNAPAIS